MTWSRPRVAAPPSPRGHLDNLTSLLYRERQTASGKDPHRVPRAVATQPGDVWLAVTCGEVEQFAGHCGHQMHCWCQLEGELH